MRFCAGTLRIRYSGGRRAISVLLPRRVVKSIIEGAVLVRKDTAVTKRALPARLRVQDEKELEETYQFLCGFTQAKPYPSAGFRAILADLSRRMPAARSADPGDLLDARFIEELDRSGYIDGL